MHCMAFPKWLSAAILLWKQVGIVGKLYAPASSIHHMTGAQTTGDGSSFVERMVLGLEMAQELMSHSFAFTSCVILKATQVFCALVSP